MNKSITTAVQILLVGLLFFYGNGNPIMAQERPYILITESKETLRKKIQTQPWAQTIYSKIVDRVQPYVERHKTDPEWIVSRLQMHWKTRYKRTFVNGQVWSHGEGRAPVPTVRFAGGRDWATPYARPALEDIRPYEEDPRGMWLQNRDKPDRPWEWAPVSETGQVIERINEQIMSLAESAAFLYWYTGDEAYAKFASDIFWTYVQGMHHRQNPETFEDHSKARILGLATFEVIHEAITRSLAITYDFLREYLMQTGKDTQLIENLFKRWADRIIEGGNAHGNWNINQARFIVYLGLTLQPNSAYQDGKGQAHYIAQFTDISTENQTALKDLIPVEYDQKQGIWPEAPGYAFSVTDNILQLAHVIHNKTGEDVTQTYPILEKAALVVFQYLFPNGLTVGFGDTYHQAPNPVTLELLITRARRNSNLEMEQRLTAALKQQMALCDYKRESGRSLFSLTSFVDTLISTPQESTPLTTRTFYAPPVSLIIQRNGTDPTHGLMASLVGTQGGHMHANGLALEIYGQGMVIGPDVGRGSSYWQKEHGEYYKRFPAHNTVIVNGQSNYNDRDNHPFELLYVEPQSESQQALSEHVSFFDVAFDEPKTQSDQRRLVSLIRTSPTTGYYVDIFRSKKRDGQDIKHEYLYHNLGQSLHLTNKQGDTITTSPTDELHTEHGDLIGYNYFTEKQKVAYNGDFTAHFQIALQDAPNVTTKLWMAGAQNRTLFTAQSPRARTIIHGSAPEELHNKPVPILIARQQGEAWKRPFIGVIESFNKNNGTSISHIETLEGEDEFVGLEIHSKHNKRVEYILNDTDREKVTTVNNTSFQGIYGVISTNANGLQYLYLSHGKHLAAFGYKIESTKDFASACLYQKEGQFYLSTTAPITLQTPSDTQTFPAGYGQIVTP